MALEVKDLHEPEYYTARQLAEMLGVGKMTVYRWAWKGVIPSISVRPNGARRFPADVVERLKAQSGTNS